MICAKCKIEKGLVGFSACRIRDALCKQCIQQSNKAWREANKERIADYQSAWKAANREKVNAYKRKYGATKRPKDKAELHDNYLKNLLIRSTGARAALIPAVFLVLYRAHKMLDREIKEKL